MEEPTPAKPASNQTNSSSQVPVKRNNKPLIIAIILIFLLMAGGIVYLGYQNYQLQQRLDLLLKQQTDQSQSISTPTPAPTSPTPNSTLNWKTYTDPTHNFTIKYPNDYVVSGKLANSLETWKAGQGIVITNPNDTAKPRIFIEAVYDGYGPFFESGLINAKFTGNQLVVEGINKKTEAEYALMIEQGYITSGQELFISRIITYKDVPFWFHISHQDRGNTNLERTLVQILSTFKFKQ
jgi:hypothetical protein